LFFIESGGGDIHIMYGCSFAPFEMVVDSLLICDLEMSFLSRTFLCATSLPFMTYVWLLQMTTIQMKVGSKLFYLAIVL
jgi:hypothetical protein